ncbi:histidine kinase [Corynebacterium sp. H128]|uniref:sensor histidine kinase n=1 Tax=unclassified Corynebacterium TaxID=2624378 RepID=UPI0030B276D4
MVIEAPRPRWKVATAISWGLGLLLYLFMLPVIFNFQDIAALPPEYVTPRIIFWLAQLPTGIFSLVCLPFLLRSKGEQQGGYLLGAATVFCGWFSALGVIAGLYALVQLASKRTVRSMTIGAIAAQLGAAANLAVDPDKSDIVPVLWTTFLLILACIIAGTAKGKRREAAELLWQKVQLNEAILREHEAMARYDERLNIARDMHDSLAHRLSLITLHAGVLEFRNDLQAAELQHQASTISEQARAAVTDLQEVLSVLRTEPDLVDPRVTIAELVEQARSAGTHIDLSISPNASRALENLSTAAKHTAHRMVQEALTNARKHAPQAPVSVDVVADDALRIAVSNPSSAPDTPMGKGLIGLHERATLCGGKLSVIHHPFTVTLELPCQQSALE